MLSDIFFLIVLPHEVLVPLASSQRGLAEKWLGCGRLGEAQGGESGPLEGSPFTVAAEDQPHPPFPVQTQRPGTQGPVLLGSQEPCSLTHPLYGSLPAPLPCSFLCLLLTQLKTKPPSRLVLPRPICGGL